MNKFSEPPSFAWLGAQRLSWLPRESQTHVPHWLHKIWTEGAHHSQFCDPLLALWKFLLSVHTVLREQFYFPRGLLRGSFSPCPLRFYHQMFRLTQSFIVDGEVVSSQLYHIWLGRMSEHFCQMSPWVTTTAETEQKKLLQEPTRVKCVLASFIGRFLLYIFISSPTRKKQPPPQKNLDNYMLVVSSQKKLFVLFKGLHPTWFLNQGGRCEHYKQKEGGIELSIEDHLLSSLG